ncbi:hypothetical protein [Defluviimonas sp. SAOS-178_SWC]|uniref:hypothetical protein n=1 Tax=Defluviimonas sp. SAOS-178_SWC TaxID=3121287 RepID=UPI0032219116
MKGIGLLFFASGVVYVVVGMALGIWMGAAQDFTLAPAHAHLNLLGFVTMCLMGIFYQLTPKAAERLLSRVHFGLATLGLWLMVPGIAIAVNGGGEAFAIAGSLVTAAAMVTFLVNLVQTAMRPSSRGAALPA